MNPAAFELSVDASQWVLLDLLEAEAAKNQAIDDPALANFKKFCQMLRSSKLRFLSEDRQARGDFDDGAGLLIEWADEVLASLEAANEAELVRVEKGIREHRDYLKSHLTTPIEQRRVIE